MSALTLEELLCLPSTFGLTTATPLQRAICRIADGLPLAELAGDPTVIASVGGEAAVAALPIGAAPKEVDLYSAIRTAKSLLAAAAAVRCSQSVDLSHLRTGEVPRIPVVSLTVDTARVVFAHLVGALTTRPALRTLLVGEPTADAVVLRHPSGRHVEIKVVAGARAGGSLVARWLAGVVFDELPRMLGSDDGAVVNVDDALAAVEGRLLDGAQIWGIGSPWAPWGKAYEDVENHHGRPTPHKVVLRAQAHWMNPMWWTEERRAALLAKNPRAYRTDVLGEFADASASVFTVEQIDRAEKPRDATGATRAARCLFLDPSSGRKDTFAWMVAGWNIGDANRYLRRRDGSLAVNSAGEHVQDPEWKPSPPYFEVQEVGGIEGAFYESTSGEVIADRLAEVARAHGIKHVHSDQREALMLRAALERRGLRFHEHTWTSASKPQAVEILQRWFIDGLISLPRHAKMRKELVTFARVVNAAGGFTFGARGSGHDDYVAVLLTAALADADIENGGLPRSPHRNYEEPRMGKRPIPGMMF